MDGDVGSGSRKMGARTRRPLLILVLALLVGAAVAVVALRKAIEPREVGPDADEMAKDPVLQVSLEGTSRGEVIAHTGTEGGVAPALADRTSNAFRFWTVTTGDPQSVLVAAVHDLNTHDVAWGGLTCSPHQISAHGSKDVLVRGEIVSAGVYVAMSLNDGEPDRLLIQLGSDGSTTRRTPRPELDVIGDCPRAVSEALDDA